jgi:hypothetical protein
MFEIYVKALTDIEKAIQLISCSQNWEKGELMVSIWCILHIISLVLGHLCSPHISVLH